MRKITGAVFQSLDGVMQAPGGPSEDPTGGFTLGGWQWPLDDEVAGEAIGALCTSPFSLLLGRRTYDIFSSYWPYVEGESAALGEAFTRADKFVLTHGTAPLEWENSHALHDFAALAEVKAGDGPELRIWGSASLYPGLLAGGLLDQITVLTYPVLLGSGKRTFREGTPPRSLRVVNSVVGPTGAVVATYEPAGDVAFGESPVAPPNPRELERQRRIAEGTW